MKNVQQKLAELSAEIKVSEMSLQDLQELSAVANLLTSKVNSEIARRCNYASKHIPTRKND